MKGDENKPIDSSELHKTTAINVPVRRYESKPEHIAQENNDRSTETEKDDASVSVSVVSHDKAIDDAAESITIDSIEKGSVDPEETPDPDPVIELAEELKIEEKIEPEEKDETTSESPSTKDTLQKNEAQNTPGVLVLQWLTYAFWGWTNIILIWLTSIVATYLVSGESASLSGIFSSSAWALAGLLVLLPLSLVCDWVYRKKEPLKKTGAANVLMIIHAVIFALFGVGSLILFAYALVQYMLVPPSDLDFVYILMISSIAMALFYGATFLRTLNPFTHKKAGLYLSIFMTISVIVLIAVNVVGPIKTQKLVQQDQETVRNLNDLVSAIDNYATENKKLPASLSDSSFSGNNNPLVVDNKVSYKITDTTPVIDTSNTMETEYGVDTIDTQEILKTLSFQICVTYLANTTTKYSESQSLYENRTTDSFYVYNHKDGNVCYDLKTSVNLSH